MGKLVDFFHAQFLKDAFNALETMQGFVTDIITQRYQWHLTLAVKHAFQKKMLSTSTVQEIVSFLSERFLVKPSGIEYVRAFTHSTESVARGEIWFVPLTKESKSKKVQTYLKPVRDYFHLNMLQKIQGAVDSGLIEYSDALTIVTCAVENYPGIKLSK